MLYPCEHPPLGYALQFPPLSLDLLHDLTASPLCILSLVSITLPFLGGAYPFLPLPHLTCPGSRVTPTTAPAHG